MSEQLVITALGSDRPGIVDQLSKVLYTQQLNIEDSRMSSLGGEFAMLLLVSGEADAITDFISNSASIAAALDMQLQLKQTRPTLRENKLLPYVVEVVAMDHPGIVHNLASFFASRQINIVDLETDCYPAPHTGTPMFSIQMTIGIPADMPIKKLRAEFLQVCDELNMDASMTSA